MYDQQIPLPIIEYLKTTDGIVSEFSSISSTTKSNVMLITTNRCYYIAKRPSHLREINFYRFLAHDLRMSGLPVPLLFWSGHNLGVPWILIEYLPHLLPDSRWNCDSGVIEHLSLLHTQNISLVDKIEDYYRPLWTHENNCLALECLDPKDRKNSAQLLDAFYKQSQYFWQQQVLISGDANPRNWGLRIDGTLVAFDWQKIGLGPVAIDLATYMCSDETFEMAKNIAHEYCKRITPQHPLFSIKPMELAKQIMYCCVWNYVKFLNEYMQHQRDVSEKIIEHISQFFPTWLKNTDRDLKIS